MDPEFIKNQVRKQQEAYEFSQRHQASQSCEYIFNVTLSRNVYGIESNINVDVTAFSGKLAKEKAENELLGWKSGHYTCKGEV